MDTSAKQTLDRLTLMQTFIRIVEAGSLSAAAVQMNSTQPTVSRRLQTLERSLGLTLLHRSTHALTLTEVGARYYERAKELLIGWSEFEADLRGTVDEPQGMLRVVAPHAFGQQQLVGPLTDFLARFPKVSVEWLLYDGPLNFVERGVDCAIRVGTVTDPSVVAIKIAEVPRIVVAAPGLIGTRKRLRQPDALADLPWLALGPYYRNEIVLHNAQGEEQTLAIQPRITTDSLYALRSAALRGAGITALSAWVVEEDLASGTLVHIVPDWQASPLPVYLLYPHAAFYPAKLRSFVEVMRYSMADLPWRGRRAKRGE